MASPIQLLREGLETGNWKCVANAYFLLTGERIVEPESDSDDGSLRGFLQILKTQIEEQLDGVGEEIVDQDELFEEKPKPKPKPKAQAERLPDFHIEHRGETQSDSDKGKQCRTLPLDTGPSVNRWKDNPKLAAKDRAESRKLSKKFTGKDYRDEYKPVKVTCSRCDRTEEVHPDVAPKRVDKDDDTSSYVCNRCVKKGKE